MKNMKFKRLIVEVVFHSVKVALRAVQNGFDMDLSVYELIIVFFAGLLHDIGKFRVNRDILFKESKLSYYEKRQTDLHPEYSFEILKSIFPFYQKIPFLLHVMYICRHHHSKEVYYYDKLTFIIHIADCYDSLRSKRSYKDGFSEMKSKAIILEEIEKDFQLLGSNRSFLFFI